MKVTVEAQILTNSKLICIGDVKIRELVARLNEVYLHVGILD